MSSNNLSRYGIFRPICEKVSCTTKCTKNHKRFQLFGKDDPTGDKWVVMCKNPECNKECWKNHYCINVWSTDFPNKCRFCPMHENSCKFFKIRDDNNKNMCHYIHPCEYGENCPISGCPYDHRIDSSTVSDDNSNNLDDNDGTSFIDKDKDTNMTILTLRMAGCSIAEKSRNPPKDKKTMDKTKIHETTPNYKRFNKHLKTFSNADTSDNWRKKTLGTKKNMSNLPHVLQKQKTQNSHNRRMDSWGRHG